MIVKIITESAKELEFSLLADHYDKVQKTQVPESCSGSCSHESTKRAAHRFLRKLRFLHKQAQQLVARGNCT